MKLNKIDEGLADHAYEREELDARENLIAWATEASAPIDEDEEDCGFGAYARTELRKAHRRARTAGVFDDQPGEAEWMTMHRRERELR